MADPRPLPILAALLLLTVPLAANEPPNGLDKRISLDLVETNARDVFGSLGAMTGGAVDLDPAIGGKLTLRLSDVSVRTVLVALCDMLACEWTAEATDGSGPTLRIRPVAAPAAEALPPGTLDTPVTLALVNAPPETVLRSFAEILGAELDLDWGEKVTIELHNEPLEAALDRVCAQLVCRWELETSGGARRLRVW